MTEGDRGVWSRQQRADRRVCRRRQRWTGKSPDGDISGQGSPESATEADRGVGSQRQRRTGESEDGDKGGQGSQESATEADSGIVSLD